MAAIGYFQTVFTNEAYSLAWAAGRDRPNDEDWKAAMPVAEAKAAEYQAATNKALDALADRLCSNNRRWKWRLW